MKTFIKIFTATIFASSLLFSNLLFADNVKDSSSENFLVDSGKLTPEYVEQAAAEAYFWAWPLINIYNRYENFKPLTESVLLNGIAPVGPTNHLSMLTDYIAPQERDVACPNQDVVYGSAVLNLEKEPVVIQVPDFKGRFWVYQIVNQRTDSFAKLGAMYDSKPGFYLLAGPNWKGETPKGISGVFRSDTNIGYAIPRVFVKDSAADKTMVLEILNKINLYPLSEFTGEVKIVDWTKTPILKGPAKTSANGGEAKWVLPEKALEEIETVLNSVQPLAGEEALYANFKNVINSVKKYPELKESFIAGAKRAEEKLISPLLQFSNYGKSVKYNWSTIDNGASFGVDYFTRTAAARSNIFVNAPNETKYFYQDLDENGVRLDGNNNYEITFLAGQTPPVKGFWSLTMYDKTHFFVPNKINRYSLGTKNENLSFNKDGSLTIYIQSEEPTADKLPNWLPAPKDKFSLYIRAYWPNKEALDGSWTPPAVIKK